MEVSTIKLKEDIGVKNISVSLVQCPAWGRETPPVAISLLAGNLRNQGYKVHLFDLNNEYFYKVSDKYKIYWGQEYFYFWESENSVKELLDQYQNEVEQTVEQIAATGSKIVGFSLVFTCVHFTMEIAKKLKELSPETMVVLGGPSTAEYAGGLNFLDRSFVDAIVLREGDITFPEICKDIEEKGHLEKIPGLIFKKDGAVINGGLRAPVQSLDSIPFADFTDYDFTKYADPTRIDLFSSRGCINKCHYCDERQYLQRYRYRSGKRLFEELRYHMSYNPNIKSIFFCDSVVNGSLKAMHEFSELLIRHDIKVAWGGQAVVRKDMDAGLLNLMAKAGCAYLCYGIETGSEKVLKTMNKKLATIEADEQNLKDTHNAGIRAYANFMFGYPTETEEDFLQTLDFVRRNRPWIDGVSPSLSFTNILPNTYLYENLVEFGIDPKRYHHLYWSTRDRENTYPIRFDRYERFCRLCIELGLTGVGVVEERLDKWKKLGDYYTYIKDYEKATECFALDLLNNGYSCDSIKHFLENYTNEKGIKSSEPFKAFERLLAYINPGAIRDKVQRQEAIKKKHQISRLEAVIRDKDKALSNICNSYGWKALLKCYQIRDNILPPDSKLRVAFNKLFNKIISRLST
jgi:anaerobic magnesium-protoporphyrin IX monomethyl ester cyclase